MLQLWMIGGPLRRICCGPATASCNVLQQNNIWHVLPRLTEGFATSSSEPPADAEGTESADQGSKEKSSLNDTGFAGDEKVYGKVQEYHDLVADQSKEGMEPSEGHAAETLEATGFDLSNRTTPHGGE